MAVSEDIELIVEDTELPRRLKEKVYSVIEEKGVTDADTADQIAQQVERKYVDTRVDPLDPVGTVSAQSIGEPGTQMSIPADEQILLRRDGETETTDIGPFVDSLMKSRETRAFDDHEVALAPDGVEVLSLGRDEQLRWKPIEEISRHTTPDELLRFRLESGRTIRATKAHSFVTRKDNDVVPVAGSDLEAGDWLPIIGEFSIEAETESIDLREYLPPDEYWYTSSLTDGGTKTAVPGKSDQIRDTRTASTGGKIEEHTVYPVQGTVGLPERFPLDEETGFFIGALLAEGNVTDYYVSVSNVDSEFQERIRSFANRFDLSVNEYENRTGSTDGYDIRVNGKALADLIKSACLEGGSKTVPGFAFGASEGFVCGLLNGYFSGDGDISKPEIRASSISKQLIEGITLLLARVGVYATRSEQKKSHTLRIPNKHVPRFAERVGMVGKRGEQLAELAEAVDPSAPDVIDQIPNFGGALESVAKEANIPQQQFNSATKRQRIGRNRLSRLVDRVREETTPVPTELDVLQQAVEGDIVWDRIESIETIEDGHEYVYDVSVAGLETFTTSQGVVTHNTMNTFHYAGVAEIDVTQGLPRLIELVDARKTPDTPTMRVHLEEEYAGDREKAHEVVWKIEATRILALGDVSTNVADMLVRIDLNEETLRERWPTVDSLDAIVTEIASTIEGELGVETYHQGTMIEFGPDEPSYRDLLQLVEELRDIVFKGIGDVSRVVIRKEELDDGDGDQEFVLYTEGAAFGKVLEIEGVDATRTTTNNIHEVHRVLGVEAARERIIEETMDTLEEQGLGEVNIRHLMLVADIMTNRGTIESIGRHGISGNKESVLARAAFEVTVNHLLDAAVHGESDELDGVTENVIVGKPIKLGTGDVRLRMSSTTADE